MSLISGGLSSRALTGLKPSLFFLLSYLLVNLSDFELSLLLRTRSTENTVFGEAEGILLPEKVAQTWRPDQSNGQKEI